MKKINEETIKKHQKTNRKLLVLYRMLASDLLFYYTISYLFLSSAKGLSTAQIVFGESFYPFFKLISQLPCTILVQKIGKRNSLIVANTSLSIFLFLTITLSNPLTLIVANFFCAIAYVIKGISEANLLYDSIENTENKRDLFSKYEGNSSAIFYLFDAITAFSTGFLFAINPYFPLILSLLIVIITVILSCCLKEIPVIDDLDYNSNVQKEITNYTEDLKSAFKFIFKSARLRALIFYDALFVALISIMVTLRNSILTDLNVPAEHFGIIFAILGIASCLLTRKSLAFHNFFKNNTLTFLGISLTLSIFITGFIVLIDIPASVMFPILLAMFAIQCTFEGPFYTLIKRYLSSFCDSNLRIKITSAATLTESLTYGVVSMASAFILRYISNASMTLILGGISTFIMIILTNYMITRVGLKPEEYSKKDINFNSN